MEYAWIILLPFIILGIILGLKRKRQSVSSYSRSSSYSDYNRGRDDERRLEDEYQRGRAEERERINLEREYDRKERRFYRDTHDIGKSFTDAAEDSAKFAHDFFEGPKKKRKNNW